MYQNGVSNRFNFGSRYFKLELVIILDANLLNSAQGVPAMFNDIVKVSPSCTLSVSELSLSFRRQQTSIIEISSRDVANSPDIVKCFYH